MSVALLGVTALGSFSATAETVGGQQIGVQLPGSEIRRNAKLTLGHRFDVIRLHSDHTVRGNWRLEYDVHFPSGGGHVREGGINGEWSWENGQLCLFGYGIEHRGRQCYRLARKGDGKQYTMTNTATGQVWEMFFYPASTSN